MPTILAFGLLVMSLPGQQVLAAECNSSPDQAHCKIYEVSCTKETCWPDKPFKEQCKISDPNWETTYEGQVNCKYCQNFPDFWCDEHRIGGKSCGKACPHGGSEEECPDEVSKCGHKLHKAFMNYSYPKKEGKYANFEEACAAMLEAKKCYQETKACSFGAAWVSRSMNVPWGASPINLMNDKERGWSQCPGLEEDLECVTYMAGKKKLPTKCNPVDLSIRTAEQIKEAEREIKEAERAATLEKYRGMAKTESWKRCKENTVPWGKELLEKGCISGNWEFDQAKVCNATWDCDARGKCTTSSEEDCPKLLEPAYARLTAWSQAGNCKAGADGMVCGIYKVRDPDNSKYLHISFCSAEDVENISKAVHVPAAESLETDPGASAAAVLKKCRSPNICESEVTCKELTINFQVEGVQLKSIKNMQKSRIMKFIAAEFAKAAGVSSQDVTVKLSAGSIVVEVTIKTRNLDASKAAVTGDAGGKVAKNAIAAASDNLPCKEDCVTTAPAEGAVTKKDPAKDSTTRRRNRRRRTPEEDISTDGSVHTAPASLGAATVVSIVAAMTVQG